MTPVRTGLVGYGTGGRFFHAPFIASAPECDFVGVVTTSAARRAELARDHPGVPALDSLADLVAAGAEAVSIATPAATHADLTQEALRRGLAVVTDKPFALTLDSARDTVQLALKLGRTLTVYQNRRWDSDLLTLKRLIDDGSLGDVLRFESRFERFSPDAGPRASGGGALWDLGSHLVDQAMHLFGPVELVYAEAHLRIDTGLDDDTFVALTHQSGVRSHLWASWRQGAPGPRLKVAGTAGAYTVDSLDGQEDLLKRGHTPAELGDEWGVEPESAWGRLSRGDAGVPVPRERGRWDLFYPAFAAAVRGEGPPPVDPRDAVHAALVLLAARASAASGRAITLEFEVAGHPG
jgi:predicted dehydrogenase